jgi:hypothetical protein
MGLMMLTCPSMKFLLFQERKMPTISMIPMISLVLHAEANKDAGFLQVSVQRGTSLFLLLEDLDCIQTRPLLSSLDAAVDTDYIMEHVQYVPR